jgi:hypothetical protein
MEDNILTEMMDDILAESLDHLLEYGEIEVD